MFNAHDVASSSGSIGPVSPHGAHPARLAGDVIGPPCSCAHLGYPAAVSTARAVAGHAAASVGAVREAARREKFAANEEFLTCLVVFNSAGAGEAMARGIVE